MSALRLLAIAFIFGCTAVAWFTLGASLVHRSGEKDYQLEQEVAQLWGGPHLQVAPDVYYESPRQVVEEQQERDLSGNLVTRKVTRTVVDRIPLALQASRVDVDLALAHRRKGLLWYDTYEVGYESAYVVINPTAEPRLVLVHFAFPSAQAIYDGFGFELDGRQAAPVTDLSAGLTEGISLPPGGRANLAVRYRSRGLGQWSYAFTREGVAQVRDFQLTLTTDFAGIDFPAGTMSPTTKERTAVGYRLLWRFESLVTGQKVGMDLPNKTNPGPLASRITFFAPVSLLFFLTVMVILGALRGESLHPMNYFFVAAAFFSFHLLLAYLVDHLNIHASFAIASATSIFLVVSYLRLAAGMRFALLQAGAAQLVFLVLFSYAFFFEGYTGLTVTVGAVVTLFLLMQLTGRVDWAGLLARSRPRDVPAGAVNVDLCMP